MSKGHARVVKVPDMQGFAETLAELQPNEAIALGVFADGATEAAIASRKAVGEGERTRTKGGDKGFAFIENQPALLLLDIDMDHPIPGFDGTAEGVWDALTRILPGLKGKTFLARASTSSDIWYYDRRLDNPQTTGFHFYVGVTDGSEIPAILKRIDEHLWLSHKGSIKISKSGSRLFRAPVDAAVRALAPARYGVLQNDPK